MGFFEFDSESLEATAPAARSSSSATRRSSSGTSSGSRSTPRTSRGSTGSASTASTSSAARTTPTTSRPAPSPSARSTSTTSSTTSRGGASTTETPSKKGGGFSFSQFAPYLQQGWNFAQLVAPQIAQQFAGGRGALSAGDQPPPAAPSPADAPAAPPTTTTAPGAALAQPAVDTQPPTTGVPDAGVAAAPAAPGATAPPAPDSLSFLLQALQQRQITPLPGSAAQMPGTAAAVPGVAPQADGLALLRTILTNPQFQQTLHLASSMGAAGPRAVSLPVPVVSQPRQRRAVQIPLGAVMNAIALLARQSVTELNTSTREDEPEVPSYLVDEQGDYIVNPADAAARASLVTCLFELSEQAELAEQAEQTEDLERAIDETEAEMDESDEWAAQAGFKM